MSQTDAFDPDAEFHDLPSLVAHHAKHRGGHVALIDGSRQLDYAALDTLVDRVAAALRRDGIGADDAVATIAVPSIEHVAVMLGILRAGAVFAPMPASATPATIALLLKDSGARLVFGDFAPSGEDVLPVPAITFDGKNGETAFDRWLGGGAAAFPAAIPAPDARFNIIYSSGTTGMPKGIVHSHAMRWQHIRRGVLAGYAADAVTLISTPLYSNTTLVSLIPALASGGTAVLMRKFDAASFLQLAERHAVTHAMLVPVQYRRLLDHPTFDSTDLSSFRIKTSTSAPLSAAIKREILDRWPGGLIEIYGMTEGGGTTVLAAHLFPDKLGSVGVPVDGHHILLIDEAGERVAAGEIGEIVGHSPAMMTGYHGRSDLTRETMWFDGEGRPYIRTGDVGRFDQAGFLYLLDRRKDLIISGGFNIYPSDLEAVLARHPAVRECAVVAAPSEQWGETPVAFMVRSGDETPVPELRDWVNGQVGRMQRLHAVIELDELPRNAIGKIEKAALRARLK